RLAAASVSLSGLFAVNKPPGISCAGVLDYLKRNLGMENNAMPFAEHFEREEGLRKTGKKVFRRKYPSTLRVGHAGTLDVEAAGVLVLGVNNGCKLLSDYLVGDKSYLATGRLGVATDSYDAEGRITDVSPTESVTSDMILNVIPQFVGSIKQIPPLYSAIRMDGKRLYEYMREGHPIPDTIKPRNVKIDDIKLVYYKQQLSQTFGKCVAMPANCIEYFSSGKYKWNKGLQNKKLCVGDSLFPYVNQPNAPTFQLLVQSGGGVYIRSLIHDIGMQLECNATMITLVRTSQGPFIL
ncbi:pseudouridine synthase, partial [Coemansia spiralis]